MSEKIPTQNKTDIMDLLKRYRSFDDPQLTDEVLANLGFMRKGPGRIVTLAHAEKISKDEQFKEDHIPFDTISFSATRNRIGRSDLTHKDWDSFAEKLDVHEAVMNSDNKEPSKILYANHPGINALMDSMLSTSVQAELNKNQSKEYHYVVADLFNMPAERITIDLQNALSEPFRRRLEIWIQDETVHEDNQTRFHQEWSEKEYDELERIKGRLADPDFYEAKFAELMASRDMFDFQSRDVDYSLPDIGWNNSFELVKGVFEIACRRNGWNGVADLIRQAGDITAMRTLSQGTLPSTEEKKELRANLKKMTVEEKKATSSQMSELDGRRKKEKLMMSAVEQYFSLPQRLADMMRKRITEVQNQIMLGGKSNEKVEFTLNGKPNSELDRDPGKISGDCTEGKPLPFDVPTLPLYNVKVFSQDKKHIGNIYLYETTVGEGTNKKPIWHLDAIQIPANVDWSEGIANLFDSLKVVARAKNIPFLSISTYNPHISNYNYIADAAIAYVKGIKAQKNELNDYELQEYAGKSQLQTDGVVWTIKTSD